jgi:iron(III) transport system substrate-binding protein
LGTLFIPNTLAIIKDCPHPEQARRLVEYLLQPEIESRLAQGPSGQIPLNPQVDVPLRVETPRTVKAMEIDFVEAARHWDEAARFLRDRFFTAQ